MAETPFKSSKTPGVYITELDGFPPSIVGVQTAVPVFIGYTQQAEISGKPVYLNPMTIRSLVDYQSVFGGDFASEWDIDAGTETHHDFKIVDAQGATTYFKLEQTDASEFHLYNSLRMFYENGGGDCYVVSVGDYTDSGADPAGRAVAEADLQTGLTAAGDQVGPTMTVIPDAVLLPRSGASASGVPVSADFAKIVKAMLAQADELRDRIAILDVYGTQALRQDAAAFDLQLDEAIAQFHEDVGDGPALDYGAAYFPFLQTSIIAPDEVTYLNFSATGLTELTTLLDQQATELYTGSEKLQTVKGYVAGMATTSAPAEAVTTLNNNLRNALPLLVELENIVATMSGVLPPSGAMAGVYTLIDSIRGVWNAPANTALNSVTRPTVLLNNAQQGELNVPVNGKAVDVIREFVGRGTVVWGARTLDGNSNDFRYVQVRRTLIYIEQSVKLALDGFVFAANDATTWVTVTSMISNFLQGLWSEGGLLGATASEAFSVECGLGSTMTATDVLEGDMIVQIQVQMIHPGEFIELTVRQKMEG